MQKLVKFYDVLEYLDLFLSRSSVQKSLPPKSNTHAYRTSSFTYRSFAPLASQILLLI